ncbi:glycosyltransferase [Bacillus sp. ISL-4]|uniref:glycosyltransferase n=1 Tax=Bacillus sp. ISL-4 TaxID=2819125 RepID=UPI001BE9EE91|nr:glycosyltransferase [Bacillus sp. ISL-4]MBT2667488.1 glycosyltransferase [Bacillus sp. ISL-4]MBT2672973.1 glycosyltransferase [Streptomyces sp. ISL-14]
MEIKHVAILIPSLKGGGAERVMVNLANLFVDHGLSVDLVVIKAEGPYKNQVSSKVNIVDLKCNRVAFSIKSLKYYFEKNNPKNVISTMNHLNIITMLSLKFSKIETNVILTEHTTLSKSISSSKSIKDKIIPYLTKKYYKKANKIVAVSTGVANDLNQFLNIPSNLIEVIYNPIVNDRLLLNAKEKVDHPWFNNKNNPLIVSVGRLTEAKDYPTLLKAMKKVTSVKNVNLVILGEGELREQIEQIIYDLKIEEHVQLLGFVTNPYKYMAKADGFVLSSKWEGLPTVLVEAMALGVNLISTDCESGPNEILMNGKLGRLTTVGDVEDLAQAILQTIDGSKVVSKGELIESSQRFNNKSILNKYMRLLV